MQISVNNQRMDVGKHLCLNGLLEHLNMLQGYQTQRIALAVNHRIISRSQWATFTLQNGDNITLIKATAGG